ncbi:MAG: SIMPL domain-containing protein [Candidatus Paceibacterota bacterium]
METLLSNTRFIKASIIFVIVLTLFAGAKFINEVKRSDSVGRGNQALGTITVTGTGEVKAVPDIATLYLTLSKDGATAKDAQGLLNDQVTKTLAYLKGQKIEDKDIKSEYGGVTPKYESVSQIYCVRYPCPQPEPKINGYTATQSISVKVRAVDTANDVRTGLAGLGIKDISGPTFTIDDEDELKIEARENAIEDARAKATTLAKQLHIRLGKISSFSENGNGYPIMYEAKMDMARSSAGGAPAPELPKGENTITSSVTITYEIR